MDCHAGTRIHELAYTPLNGGSDTFRMLIHEVEQKKPDSKEYILYNLYKNRKPKPKPKKQSQCVLVGV